MISLKLFETAGSHSHRLYLREARQQGDDASSDGLWPITPKSVPSTPPKGF